ncbi:hypothetical protein [Dankookia sp. P2]|uniref:hypothetical protein n=1 Tax=Dankookia sp. P2 TaxID=3423955 RepID=UPI003D66FF27
MMFSKLLRAAVLGAATMLALALLATGAFAAASDYRFELASARPPDRVRPTSPSA